MKNNKKIVLFMNLSSFFMGVCTVFNLYSSFRYIKGLTLKGYDVGENLIDVINYFITAAGPFIFFTICLFALGIVIKGLSAPKPLVFNKALEVKEEVYEKKDENIVDELLNEL